MDSSSPGGYIILFAVLLFLDIVVYGFGSALRALRPEIASQEAEPRGDQTKDRSIIRKVLNDQSDYVDTVSSVTALINLTAGACFVPAAAEKLAAAAGWPYLLCFVLTICVLLIVIEVFGVQLPKRLAAASPDKWIRRFGGIFRLLLAMLLPLIRIIGAVSRGILFVFGVRGKPLSGDVTEEEIRSMVNEGHEQGVIQQTEAEMITNIFEFSDKEARDIMTHRNDMIAIDADTPLSDAIMFMLKKHNSRFPVYVSNIDNIKGIVHLRDAVKYKELHPKDADKPIGSLGEVLRDAIYVPETKSIDDLFRQMQNAKAQMVIIIDEYGQTSGLVAMEDILEEIVGNIMDEYDIDENHITATGNTNEFIIDGRTPLEELEDRFGIDFGGCEYETLNGFMMARMDRVPLPDDKFVTEYGGYRFRVLSVANMQVQKVMLTKLRMTAGSGSAPAAAKK